MKRYILPIILVLVGCEKIEFDENINFEVHWRYQEFSFNESANEAYLIRIVNSIETKLWDSLIFKLDDSGKPIKLVDRKFWSTHYRNPGIYLLEGNHKIEDVHIKYWDPDSLIVGTFKKRQRIREDWTDFPFIWENPVSN